MLVNKCWDPKDPGILVVAITPGSIPRFVTGRSLGALVLRGQRSAGLTAGCGTATTLAPWPSGTGPSWLFSWICILGRHFHPCCAPARPAPAASRRSEENWRERGPRATPPPSAPSARCFPPQRQGTPRKRGKSDPSRPPSPRPPPATSQHPAPPFPPARPRPLRPSRRDPDAVSESTSGRGGWPRRRRVPRCPAPPRRPGPAWQPAHSMPERPGPPRPSARSSPCGWPVAPPLPPPLRCAPAGT